jgi:probable rRNA maturation factor
VSLGRGHVARPGTVSLSAHPGAGAESGAVADALDPDPAELAVVVAPADEPLAPALQRLARQVLAAEGVRGPAELGLGFVSEPDMADLNREWMGQDGATDVLAWPLDALPDGDADADAEGDGPVPTLGVPRLLGDVVVCPAVAVRQAETAGHDVADELALLVVHGVLHVLGHDHDGPEEEAAMQAREAAHLTRHHDPNWRRRSR